MAMRKAREIEYDITRKRVKNINMRIHADGSIHVSAPQYVPLSAVDEFVLSKSDFIAKAREKLESAAETVHEYIDGEKFFYLGESVTLRIKSGEHEAYIENGFLNVSLINTHSYALRKKAVNEFFNLQCEILFKKLIERYYPEFEPFGIKYPVVKIKDMKSRWGSCTPSKGIITLNKRLISVPLECIEYVVVHEYCHFLEANHSEKFYNRVSEHMPDWKERRNRLNSRN